LYQVKGKKYENRHMGDSISLSFMADYNQEEDRISFGINWHYRQESK
jgi:hypothetical protein